jgi:hypothetical protein
VRRRIRPAAARRKRCSIASTPPERPDLTAASYPTPRETCTAQRAEGTTAKVTIFELTRGVGDNWTEKTLLTFDGKNGIGLTARLVFDASGDLYGTTRVGGIDSDGGVVFELMPEETGQWTERIIQSFYSDFRQPLSPVLFDGMGDIYITTAEGGRHAEQGTNCGGFYCGGSIFKLTPTSNGEWASTVLHDFGANGDGFTPVGDLGKDPAGNIYGITAYGGNLEPCYTDEGCGTVY